MTRTALLALPLLVPGLARADEAPAPSGGGGPAKGVITIVEAPEGPDSLNFDLTLDGAGYAASVTPGVRGIALRLWRADHGSMADQGYLVPELGAASCGQAGYAFDAGAVRVLEDGAWVIEGGCR